jgi:hypothetical protein
MAASRAGIAFHDVLFRTNLAASQFGPNANLAANQFESGLRFSWAENRTIKQGCLTRKQHRLPDDGEI